MAHKKYDEQIREESVGLLAKKMGSSPITHIS